MTKLKITLSDNDDKTLETSVYIDGQSEYTFTEKFENPFELEINSSEDAEDHIDNGVEFHIIIVDSDDRIFEEQILFKHIAEYATMEDTKVLKIKVNV